MGLEKKFEKWSSKVSKGSEEYIAIAYDANKNVAFHVLDNERLDLDQMYVGVFDKGKAVSSFYYCAGLEPDAHRLPKMAVIIKEEKEVICNIGADYYSNQNEDKSMELIILYSSKMYAELIFAAPESIPYMVADYGTLNGISEVRFRYAKLLIGGVQIYLEQHGTETLPEIFVDTDIQLCEEETNEE